MYVIPEPGRQVADPDKGGYLPEAGREVEPSTYWLRRVQDGDVKEHNANEVQKPQTADKKGPK